MTTNHLFSPAVRCGFRTAACVALGVVATDARAASRELLAGAGETATNFVASGETAVQDARVITAEDGRVAKSGAGTWVLPANVRQAVHPVAVDVLEGTVTLAAAAGEVPTNPVPAFVAETAAMWLDASATASLSLRAEGESRFVDTWFDVRETTPDAPTRWHAKANLGGDLYGWNRDTCWTYTAPAPELKERENRTMVWFGGHSSSRSMTWHTPSGMLSYKRRDSNVRHVFVLRGAWDAWGTIVGVIEPGDICLDPSMDAVLLAPSLYGTQGRWGTYASTEVKVELYLRNARLYENGVRVDPCATYPCKGLALLDFSMVDEPFAANTFFNPRNMIGSTCPVFGGDRGGGEYIAEAIVFTNALTETERLQVEGYLMQKWLGTPTAQTTDIRLSPTATAEIASQEGAGATVSGNGRYRIAGDGDIACSSKDRALPTAGLELGSGAATLTKVTPLAASAGEALDAAFTDDGPRVTRAAAATADALVKTGTGEVSIMDFPCAAKALDVQEGRLTVRPRGGDLVSTRSPIPVAIANPGFEEGWSESQKAGGVWFLNEGSNLAGWRVDRLITGSGDAFGYYWPSGTRGPGTDWGLWAKPIEGDCFVLIRMGFGVSTPVTIPEDGTYELTFLWAGRRDYDGGQMAARLISDDGSQTSEFGRVIVVATDDFRICRFRRQVAAGAYRLQFATLTSEDRPIILDDVRLARVFPVDDGSYPVPGGDFEGAAFSSNTALETFTPGGTADGWTFGAFAGPVTYLRHLGYKVASRGSLYNDSRYGAHGSSFVQLALTNATQVTTTFRPPAGVWCLTAALDHLSGNNSTLSATVTTRAGEVALGAVAARSHLMDDVTWPTAFVADGAEDVTLTLTFDNASHPAEGLLLDNVRLVKAAASGLELVKNGGFEVWFNTETDPTTNWQDVKGAYARSSAIPKAYKEQEDHWGHARYEGDYRLNLLGDAYARQTLTFPAAGHYRLSLHMSHRCEPDFPTYVGFGENPVRIWLTRGGAYTNALATLTDFTTNYVQHVIDFAVPEAGAWDLAIGGTWVGDKSSLIDGVSVTPIEVGDAAPAFNSELVVKVAAGAQLDLSYVGTNRVGRIRLGGRTATGVVNAETHPGFIRGFGSLYAEPRGSAVIIR